MLAVVANSLFHLGRLASKIVGGNTAETYNERGFTLLEAVVTMMLTTMVMGGVFDAMLMVAAHSRRPMQDAALMSVAQNILTDLSASVAYYDPSTTNPAPNPLASLYGTTTQNSVDMPMPTGAQPSSVTVNCTTTIGSADANQPADPRDPNRAAPAKATVHCHNPTTGSDVTVTSWLANQAPLPGSSIQGIAP